MKILQKHMRGVVSLSLAAALFLIAGAADAQEKPAKKEKGAKEAPAAAAPAEAAAQAGPAYGAAIENLQWR